MVVVLKACKRCGGDMSYEMDIFGHFRQCVQSSYLEDLIEYKEGQYESAG